VKTNAGALNRVRDLGHGRSRSNHPSEYVLSKRAESVSPSMHHDELEQTDSCRKRRLIVFPGKPRTIGKGQVALSLGGCN
jgi:hypothetical protein